MSCGIESPQPIKECAGPSQCRPGKRSHGCTEEQEDAYGSNPARHLVPNNFVGARVGAVSHLLTILKVENAEGRPHLANDCCKQDFLRYEVRIALSTRAIAERGKAVVSFWRSHPMKTSSMCSTNCRRN